MHISEGPEQCPQNRGESHGFAMRRWLVSHDSTIRIKAPEDFRQGQQEQALEMLALAQRRPGS